MDGEELCKGLGKGLVTPLVLEPSLEGPGQYTHLFRNIRKHVVLGYRAILRAAVEALAAGRGHRKRGRPLGGLSPSCTASSSHKLLPVYFVDKVKAGSSNRSRPESLVAVV